VGTTRVAAVPAGCYAVGPRHRRRAARASVIGLNPESSAAGLKAAFLDNRTALFRYLCARKVPADEAEDILQDLFVKLEGLKPGPIAEPPAYLHRMAENLLYDRRRTAGWRTRREEAWMAAQLGGMREADGQPSAERTLIAREELELVSAALAGLPEKSLRIFSLYRLDGLRQREIASQLGISVSSVEKHLRRAYEVVMRAQAGLVTDNESPLRHREEGR
jgi:RNA polymerase sigma-70 factor (ECF subfamily)